MRVRSGMSGGGWQIHGANGACAGANPMTRFPQALGRPFTGGNSGLRCLVCASSRASHAMWMAA
jgi:hypothetical protein